MAVILALFCITLIYFRPLIIVFAPNKSDNFEDCQQYHFRMKEMGSSILKWLHTTFE